MAGLKQIGTWKKQNQLFQLDKKRIETVHVLFPLWWIMWYIALEFHVSSIVGTELTFFVDLINFVWNTLTPMTS